MGFFPLLIALSALVFFLAHLTRTTLDRHLKTISDFKENKSGTENERNNKAALEEAQASYNKLVKTYPSKLFARMFGYLPIN